MTSLAVPTVVVSAPLKDPRPLPYLFPLEFRPLEDLGYCVKPELLLRSECRQGINNVFGFIERYRKYYDEVKSHPQAVLVHRVGRGLLTHFGAPHSDAAWLVRQHPRVIDAFRRLFTGYGGTPEDGQLFTSFEGIDFTGPVVTTSRGAVEVVSNYHPRNAYRLDQGRLRSGTVMGVRGFLTFTSRQADDSTFIFLENSHRYHEDFCSLFRTGSHTASMTLRDRELAWYLQQPGVREVTMECRAGDLLLWDSRTVFCKKRTEKRRCDEREQSGVYVSMKPRRLEWITKNGTAFYSSTEELISSVRTRLRLFFSLRGLSFTGSVLPFSPVHLHTTHALQLPTLSLIGRLLAGFRVLTPDQELEAYAQMASGKGPPPLPALVEKKAVAEEALSLKRKREAAKEELEDRCAKIRKRLGITVVEPAVVEPRVPPTPPPPLPVESPFGSCFARLCFQSRVRPTLVKNIVMWCPDTPASSPDNNSNCDTDGSHRSK